MHIVDAGWNVRHTKTTEIMFESHQKQFICVNTHNYRRKISCPIIHISHILQLHRNFLYKADNQVTQYENDRRYYTPN